MTYLIIKERDYDTVENSYDVVDQTTDNDLATDKLQGYKLINTDKKVSFSIVNFQSIN